MPTVSEELRGAAGELAKVGVDSPRLDAELLLARVLGVDRSHLVMRGNEELDTEERTRYLALLTRRVKHEPIAYILGRRDFRAISLVVDPRVLVPRPETELLVEVGLSLPTGSRVADIGTGSGAIALALKQERPDLEVVGVEISSGALSVARMNATRLRLEIEWVEGDLLADVECDALLANLPYVEDDAALPSDVRDYEPARALFGGPDGLDLVRRLLAQVSGRPRIRSVALEIGAGQADTTTALVAAAGFTEVERFEDLARIERVVVGRR